MADIIDSWQDPRKITEVPVLPEGTTTLALRDTKVSVLDGATLPRSIQHIEITLSPLRIVRNLHLLPNLRSLNISWSVWLDSLDTEFPPSLWSLTLNKCRYLTALPKIARTQLVHLILCDCVALTTLPELPDTLETLGLYGSGVKTLPFLPDRLTFVSPSCPLEPPHGIRPAGEDMLSYVSRLRAAQRASLKKDRYAVLHESLMASAWHPSRVERWLSHGEGVLDMMMGC